VNFDGLAARKLREGSFASKKNALIRPSVPSPRGRRYLQIYSAVDARALSLWERVADGRVRAVHPGQSFL
jgi:hypothetical protein